MAVLSFNIFWFDKLLTCIIYFFLSISYTICILCSSDKVQSIVYAPQSKQLISGSDDQILALWDMAIRRQEV